MKKKKISNVVDDIRGVVHIQLTLAHTELERAIATMHDLHEDATQDVRETAETRMRIALDRVAELQTDLLEADLIETEMAVRAYERSSFSSGGDFLRSAADIAEAASVAVRRLEQARRGEGEDLEREMRELMREVETLGRLLGSTAQGMEGVAENTEANAMKEEALKPETGPGGPIRTVPRPAPGSSGNGGGGPNGGGGAGGGGCNCGDTTVFCGDATARGGAGFGFGGAGGGAAVTVRRPRRRRVPEITLAVRVTNPVGDVDEGSPIDIQWTTEGGTAPRVATIELFSPQTRADHPADFHSIVEGVRDTGTFRWTASVPLGHYTGPTATSPGNPTALPGFYIRVTITDAAGQTASDTTPIFAIVRR